MQGKPAKRPNFFYCYVILTLLCNYMDNKSRLICVFAGASTPKDNAILDNARALGSAIGREGYELVYGGGLNGVMGACAIAADAAGAKIHVVNIDRYADEAQLLNATVKIVKNEIERFHHMALLSGAEAMFALPGGPGTIREALMGLESIVYDDATAPLVLVKTPPYLDGIKSYFDEAIASGLIKDSKRNALREWSLHQTIQSVLQAEIN